MNRARLDAWRDRRRRPLQFVLDGHTYVVGHKPARVWVLAVLSEEPADLLLDVLDEGVAEALWEEAVDPDADLTPQLLAGIGRALLTQAAGRPWWQATQLVASLVDGWDAFIGVARDRGLGDPLEWPLDELCAWVYHRMTVNASAEERARLDDQLTSPPTVDPEAGPEGDGVPVGWEEAEADGWSALAAQYGSAPALPGGVV